MLRRNGSKDESAIAQGSLTMTKMLFFILLLLEYRFHLQSESRFTRKKTVILSLQCLRSLL